RKRLSSRSGQRQRVFLGGAGSNVHEGQRDPALDAAQGLTQAKAATRSDDGEAIVGQPRKEAEAEIGWSLEDGLNDTGTRVRGAQREGEGSTPTQSGQ